MVSLNRRVLAVVGSAAVLAIVGIGVAAQSKPAATKYPPQFPREGATKLFENEHVIVWEQVGRPKEAFVHKHIRDILNFQIEPGGGKLFRIVDRVFHTTATRDHFIREKPHAADLIVTHRAAHFAINFERQTNAVLS